MKESNEEDLIPVALSHKNTTFTVEVDVSTYKLITNDTALQNQYAEQVDKNFFAKADKNLPGPSAVNSEHVRTPCLSTVKSEVIWNDNLIKCLPNVRLQREPEFIKPICKKAKLWRGIAAEINKSVKINLSGEACGIKYRNLLATYLPTRN